VRAKGVRTIVDPDPINPYSTDLCNALAARGAAVELITAHGYRHAARARFPFIESAPMSAEGRHAEKAIQAATHYARLNALGLGPRDRAIHFEWLRFPFEWRILKSLRDRGIPLVWTAHNVLPHEASDRARQFHARLYRLPSEFIVHTEASRHRLAEEFGVDASRLHLVRPGMPLPPVDVVPSRGEARARLRLAADERVFLMFGQVRPYKGWQLLLNAFRRLCGARRGCHLVVAGRATPAVREEVARHVEGWEPEISRHVSLRIQPGEFLTERDAVELFRAADVVVIPYVEITHSGVMLQAFSYGRPVVCSALPGLLESLCDGATGRAFAPGSEEELATVLEEMAEGGPNGGFDEMGVLAAAKELHDWDRAAAKTLDVYRAAEGGR
jgi:glycosyltransferase involved in cell wall biosynthesis